MVTQPLRILLVEDDGSIARVIAIAMRDLGVPYHLDQAYSAEEGLELWAQEPYDLVLSDYNLRGMNGIAMIAEIKTQAPDLPTVLFTAYDERPVRQAARRKGVGEALMRKAMDIARAKGCGRIEWTVWNINAAAIGFYVKLGARPVDDEMILGIQLAK
mgnify:CR=1 FL=1